MKKTQIQKLSSGNYRKVEIIGALISEPKILLLDEITNGLDIISANKLIEKLKEINKEHNISILFASHIFSHVEKLCKRVIILYNGRILADDTLENLIKIANLKEYITLKTKEKIPKDLFDKLSERFEIIKIDKKTYKIITDDASKELKNLSKFLYENSLLYEIIEYIKIKEIGLEEVFSYFIKK